MLETSSLQGQSAICRRLYSLDISQRREYWATLALRHCPGLGNRSIGKLFEYFGSADNALANYSCWNKLGISENCMKEIDKESWRESAKKEWEAAKNTQCQILLRTDSLFPKQLAEIIGAPGLLYFVGNPDLFFAPCIGIVGSRLASRRSLEVAASFARRLSEAGITVVSGMACGIDSSAHDAALEKIGKSIGVLGTGIDIQYPAMNKRLYEKMAAEGLLVSEFAPGTAPAAYNFPVRNRIISGLSLGIVVVEAASRSGSLVTARLALEQNREVFAVPGPALNSISEGCKNLIRQGAHPVFDIEDILINLELSLRQHKIDWQTTLDKTHKDEVFLNYFDEMPNKQEDVCNKTAAKQKDSMDVKEFKKNKTSEIQAASGINNNSALVQKMTNTEVSAVILNCLLNNGPMNADSLAEHLSLEIESINTALIFMEMLGQVLRLPGARFKAK